VIGWLLILSLFTSHAEISFSCPCELKGSWGSNWKYLDGFARSVGFLIIGGFPKPLQKVTLCLIPLSLHMSLCKIPAGRSSMAEALCLCFFLPSRVPLKTSSLGKKYFDRSLNWSLSTFKFLKISVKYFTQDLALSVLYK